MSRYAPDLTIPPGFQYLVQDFTREVLRSQPSNIYHFGASFFHQKLEERTAPPPEAAPTHLQPEELHTLLLDAFVSADEQHNGFLHHARFADIFRDARLELNETQVQRVMAEADENDYGMIEYANSGFVETAVGVITAIYTAPALPVAVSEAPVDVLLGRGMHREDFDRLLEDAFFSVDPHNSGMMSRSELRRALAGCAIGFTRKEVNMLMAAADENAEGMVTYAEFLPKAFDIVRHYVDALMASGEAARSGDEWTTAVEDTFVSNDPDASGVIHRILARNLLMRSGLGLTHFAIYHLLSIVDEDDDGLLSYQSLATSAGPILHSQLNELASAIAYAKYVRKYAGTDLGEVDIKTFLKIAFGSSREMSRVEVAAVLCSNDDIVFSPSEVNALLSTVSEDETGVAITDVLVATGYDILKYIAFRKSFASAPDAPPSRDSAEDIIVSSAVAASDAAAGHEDDQDDGDRALSLM